MASGPDGCKITKMADIETICVGERPRIAVDVIGQGPLVMFLHGNGFSRRDWHDQLHAFAPRFRAAAWDARGHGASDDYDGPYRFADACDDLARVLDHLGGEAAHLVGHSMGGRIRWSSSVAIPRASKAWFSRASAPDASRRCRLRNSRPGWRAA
jgi:3-oxoadipate enol-lactonase